jgi:hypothetical protein
LSKLYDLKAGKVAQRSTNNVIDLFDVEKRRSKRFSEDEE